MSKNKGLGLVSAFVAVGSRRGSSGSRKEV